jgi:hypothetical protein
VRVIDMFREWDENGDGTVSKAEFQRAMPMLGLHAPREEVGLLFDSWDPDGSGLLEIAELTRILKRAGGGPAEVAFTKPRLDNMQLAANATPAQLRAHLANLKEECESVRTDPSFRPAPPVSSPAPSPSQLETIQAERSTARMTIEHLEAEISEMRKQHDRLSATLAAEESLKAELEKKEKSKSPHGMSDPAVLQRNLDQLRMRNAALKKVQVSVADPQTSPKEEGALAMARKEYTKLQAERAKQTLELRQLTRQLEAAERSTQDVKHHTSSRGDQAAAQKAHIERLVEARAPSPHPSPTLPRPSQSCSPLAAREEGARAERCARCCRHRAAGGLAEVAAGAQPVLAHAAGPRGLGRGAREA